LAKDKIFLEPEKINDLRLEAKVSIYRKFFAEYAREEEIEEMNFAFENEVLDQEIEDDTKDEHRIKAMKSTRTATRSNVYNYFSHFLQGEDVQNEADGDENITPNQNANYPLLNLLDKTINKEKYSGKEFVQIGIALRNVVDPKSSIIESIFERMGQKDPDKVERDVFRKVLKSGIKKNSELDFLIQSFKYDHEEKFTLEQFEKFLKM